MMESMTMRRRYIIPAVLIAVVAASGLVWAAPVQINRLALSHQDNNTILTIGGSGPLRVTHQSVEPKDGKPHRLVIDCLAAMHGLTNTKHVGIPKCVITSLRSAQNAVTPEAVVRVVMELASEPVYRVETAGNEVKVFISDPATPAFAAWTSAVNPAPKTPPVQENKVAQQSTTTAKPAPSIVTQAPAPAATAKQPAATPPQKTTPNSQTQAAVPSVKQPSAIAQKAQTTEAQSKVIPPTQAEIQTKSSAQIQTQVQTETQSQKQIPVASAPAKTETYGPIPETAAQNTPQLAGKTTPSATSAAKQPVTDQSAKSAVASKTEQTSRTASIDAEQRAKVFANMGADLANVPPPGDIPPVAGTEQKTEHLAGKEAVAPATAIKVEKQPDNSKKKASTPDDDFDKLPAVEQLSNPTVADKSSDTGSPLASVADAAPLDSMLGTASKYRRLSPKAAELKSSQVVQFPERIVIEYDDSDAGDPFKALIHADKDSRRNVDLTRMPNVDALSLVGILHSENGKSSALMEDRDGIGYILKAGDRIKDGYVAYIEDEAVHFQIKEYGWDRTITKYMEKEN